MKSRSSERAVEDVRATGRSRRTGRKGWSASELRFRRLFETARDGILILDGATEQILEANPCIIELLHRSKDKLVGKTLAELGIYTDEQKRRSDFSELERIGSLRFEHLRRSDSGEVTELEFVCNSYVESGRRLIQCNIRDIARRRENEQNLREALGQLAKATHELETRVEERTADLQQRNAELEAFSYSLSHDLRAPIRAIVSFTQLALQDYGRKVGPPATDFLNKAVSAAQRLDLLIQDVLAFSRTSRQGLAFENVDVEQLLRDILQERPEWAPPRAQIRIESPLLRVRGDRASLTQCLTNLLDNAMKFVPAGVTPVVRVHTGLVDGRVRLSIEDNGIGIPESAQARVFDLFQRAHNGYEGYGIGLAIVRRAAERMGGVVGLSSKPGQGSCFWVELPAATPSPQKG